MHRLINRPWLCLSALGLFLAAQAACGGDAKKADDPSSKSSTEGEGKGDQADKAEATASTAGGDKGKDKDGGAADAPPKKDVCSGFDIANLEDMLVKSDCEVPDAKPDMLQNPDMKGKLEVLLSATTPKVASGGKIELQVTFQNKTKEPMTLNFRIDPVARFETEAYDKSKKRVDMPAGNPPPPPKGHSAPPPAEAKVAKVTIAPAGYARVKVPWEAVKMKWAPDKVRGTAVERGYPRSPNGGLPKGKYTVKVVTPLVGVFEGGDHEVSAPKIDIEVGG
jgi:hypothetical protein